jgi:hypothetical protein
MSIRTIFCLCLIIGMAAIQLSAQVPILVRTKSNLTINGQPDLKDVYRNEKKVDSSKIKVTTYDVLRFKHRKLFWENRYTIVEPASLKTDVAFTANGSDFKQDRKTTASHFYLMGKKSTAFIGLRKRY